ncbi:cyclic nucleotide-binding domain-containing protein [Marinibaculum pumilum]|uniref:Cyclic nucleotide-binding domain-containing protein n=1 Tax=Marinibaculum pumilum TaxID=1766165 RepID=A0ABV7L9L4_9PROT
MRKVLYVLGQLSDEDVDWLAEAGERRSVAPQEPLVREGEAIEWIFFVLDGQVVVSVSGAGELARLGAGEIVGEMSLVDARAPSASVHAVQPTTVLAVPKAAVLSRLERDIAFAARFYKAVATFLSHRMRYTVQTLGYARGGEPSIDDMASQADEVDINLLDTVSKAGARFDRLLKRVMAPARR